MAVRGFMLLQAHARGARARRYMRRARAALLLVQCVVRGLLAKRRVQRRRRARALGATLIQSHWKRFRARCDFVALRRCVMQSTLCR